MKPAAGECCGLHFFNSPGGRGNRQPRHTRGSECSQAQPRHTRSCSRRRTTRRLRTEPYTPCCRHVASTPQGSRRARSSSITTESARPGRAEEIALYRVLGSLNERCPRRRCRASRRWGQTACGREADGLAGAHRRGVAAISSVPEEARELESSFIGGSAASSGQTGRAAQPVGLGCSW